jgi:hypothetical protein
MIHIKIIMDNQRKPIYLFSMTYAKDSGNMLFFHAGVVTPDRYNFEYVTCSAWHPPMSLYTYRILHLSKSLL